MYMLQVKRTVARYCYGSVDSSLSIVHLMTGMTWNNGEDQMRRSVYTIYSIHTWVAATCVPCILHIGIRIPGIYSFIGILRKCYASCRADEDPRRAVPWISGFKI